MATEDPDKNDELLKRYAKERRQQGGGFELHPATRRMLQAEVARQFRAREPEAGGARRGFSFWLGLWRGRLALGVAVAATIVLAVWLFGPGRQPQATMQLAKNDSLADESRLMGRDNRLLSETDQPGVAGQPSAPTLGRGTAFEADRKSVEELAKLKESQVAAVTASGSLSPVQDSRVDGLTRNFSDDYSIVPKQKAERLYAAPPSADALAFGVQTDSSFTYALDDSGKAYFKSGSAGGPAASFALAPGAPPVTARYVTVSTNMTSANQNRGPGLATTLGIQPQVAYNNIDTGAARMNAALYESTPRPEASKPPALPSEVVMRSPTEKPVALSRGAGAATDPVSTLASETRADALGVEQKSRSRIVADLAAPAGGALPTGAKGERLVFFRESAPRFQENLIRAARRGEPAQLQAGFAAADKSAAPEVLSQFTVEVSGDTIRVTDADQSVYEGAISNEAVVAESEAGKDEALDDVVRARKQVSLKAAEPVSGSGQDYSFRAVGSNITLRQVVIVNGRLSGADGLARGFNRPAVPAPAAAPAPTTAPTSTRGRFAPGGAGTRGAAAIATNAALTIEGTVRVGGTNEQRFRALRSPR